MKSKFQVIPVLDVLGGQAVHAVGGDRARYRPLRSILHPSPGLRELARAFRDSLGLATVYLADLDAITSGEGDPTRNAEIVDLGLGLWLDAGVRDERDVAPLLALDRVRVVAGLETLRGPDALANLLDACGPDRLIVSLDLRDGRPITPRREAWPEDDATALGLRILDMGVGRLILLDLSRVGRGSGMGTERLLDSLLRSHPHAEITVGGGVSRIEDLDECRDRGASAVLVGSALHDGRIDRRALERFLESSGG
ncbi:HisA/HisF-related TIM barrel protein [Planctomyces sp. SH-PL62]|uniref:HisA/HisF-related TIM barrel protein n=1 Tax=Planctomyces sp. SH-PL62 TaxID=1636152 RepID=UPI00078D8B9E|nr:HisA/HisF-related TIM barrel protein [Planctomyces sp. SH-PL62]AMV36861.1 1-(5-phosphoribosyl)-5-[(5-phosphoribosylamino)methylideneamino] imidazole-4-carboxamide isomerase [Planctomyces sp. SH-PL62]